MVVRTCDGREVVGYTQEDMTRWIALARGVALHWQYDRDMHRDAQARVDRLLQGIVIDIDISGLQDWADTWSEDYIQYLMTL